MSFAGGAMRQLDPSNPNAGFGDPTVIPPDPSGYSWGTAPPPTPGQTDPTQVPPVDPTAPVPSYGFGYPAGPAPGQPPPAGAVMGDPGAQVGGTATGGPTIGTAAPTPTGQPGGIASTAPLPLQAFGGLPQVSPTYVDPTQNQAYMQQYEQLMAQSMQPQFQAQDQQMQDQLAARGISNSGSAAYSMNQLKGQQDAALAGATAPIVQQGYGYGQQDITGNANAANAATSTNAGYYNEALTGNANAYNNYNMALLGYGAQNQAAIQAAYLNSYGPNTGVTSAYNTGMSGQDSTYGNVYGQANQAQMQTQQQMGQGLALAFGG